MPVEYPVPGIYIEELQPGSRPIQGVATAMPAFIGFTYTRPPDKDGEPEKTDKPHFVASWNAFVDMYGTKYQKQPNGAIVPRDEPAQPFVEGFYLPYAVYGYFQNGGQACYVQSLATPEDAGRLAVSAVSLAVLPAQDDQPALELRGKPAASGAKQITVKVADATVEPPKDENSGGKPEPVPADRFRIEIAGTGAKSETYDHLTMGRSENGALNVVEALTDSKLVQATQLLISDDLVQIRPKNASYTLEQAQGEASATVRGNVAKRTGISAFEEIPEITLMVCPDLMAMYKRSDKSAESRKLIAAMQGELLIHCAKMQDRFAILDAPLGLDIDELKTYRNQPSIANKETAKYGAIYYPWIEVTNPARNASSPTILVPPSGHLAGIYARVDADRGVHKAPANESVNGAIGLERRLIDSEQAQLNPIGVNCIRSFNGRGILVWGARTLAEASSEWRYINVRRLFNFVEESIYENTQWAVFEPNDLDTWERVRRTITEFLTRVWRSGALFGATPEEAFYVKCDATLNTKEVRDAGQLIVEIGLAPVKPAEFVIFRFKQVADGEGGVSE